MKAENKNLVVVVVVVVVRRVGVESTGGDFSRWENEQIFGKSMDSPSKENSINCCVTLQLVLATLENLLLILT